MTTATHEELTNCRAIIRSIPPRPKGPAQDASRAQQPHWHSWSPALRLVGHIAATTFVFISFITLVWVASWGLDFLHSVHPFSEDTLQLFETMKSVLIRIDAALSGVVLLRGVWQYILSVIRGDS